MLKKQQIPTFKSLITTHNESSNILIIQYKELSLTTKYKNSLLYVVENSSISDCCYR